MGKKAIISALVHCVDGAAVLPGDVASAIASHPGASQAWDRAKAEAYSASPDWSKILDLIVQVVTIVLPLIGG